MPSLLSSALYFAMTTFAAALLAEYGPDPGMPTSLVTSISAIPVVMLMTFFTDPLRTKGRKACTVCKRPKVLTLKDSRNSFSRTGNVLSSSDAWPLYAEKSLMYAALFIKMSIPPPVIADIAFAADYERRELVSLWNA